MSTNPPTTPFWFKQRQGKLEPVADNQYKITAPNQNEAVVLIREQGGLWGAAVRQTADGPDVDSVPARYDDPAKAWEVAFELYRRACIV